MFRLLKWQEGRRSERGECSMVRRGTDEDFYTECSDIFSSARGCPDIFFTSRTPTLSLAGALSPQGRR
ncbi:MAG: hypothetical protein QI223_02880, partial [Candidatus Korarchaeota archaeon]|nr:hypothetical protein [Candidatus Korarchaeota archaeon]